MALIYSIKTLKDTALMFGSNSDDRLKRCFQFVGNVCSELLAVTLRKDTLCVISKTRITAPRIFPFDSIELMVELILISISFFGIFTVITT